MEQPEREQRGVGARELRNRLGERDVLALATTWVDNSGVTRVKAVPLDRLEHAVSRGIGASPVFDAFQADDTIVAARRVRGPVGDLRLIPDLSRITVLAAQPGWAWAPATRYQQDGTVHPQDQRSAAANAVAELAVAGYTARWAFEIEWALSSTAPEFTPAAVGPAYGYTRVVERSDYLRDLLAALAEQQVSVEQIHPEYGAGQFELSVAAEDPVGAADTFVLVRETIRAVSQRHDLFASFSPKVEAEGVGNGGHVHLSLWRSGANAFFGGQERHGLTQPAAAFAAGVLQRLPALLAVGAPTPASYLRLIPSHWAGAFQVWGLENREAALRLITGGPRHPDAANLEIKCFDQAANPYLLVASVIFAGLAGMREQATLPEPVEVDPITIEPAERAARGIVALPTSLAAATDAFAAEPALLAGLGADLAETIVDLRRDDVARFAAASAADMVAAARWKY